jgi:hypothetical protein
MSLDKRIVGRPQARWSDDLRRTVGRSWMRVAEDQRDGEKLERPMSSSGLYWADDDEMISGFRIAFYMHV